MDGHSFMKELIENPGHCHIVRNISSFLDVKSLAQCRLVCHSWRDLIDNDRPWLVFQLQHIHGQEKRFVDYLTKGKPKVKDTIDKRFLEWSAFIQQVSRKQSIQSLKGIVREMWRYFKDELVSYNANPLHDSVGKSRLKSVKLLADCGIDLTMTTPYGWTPMHIACRNSNVEMVQLLLKHAPTFDATTKTKNGETIFHLAVYNPNHQVPKLILDMFRFEDIRDNNGRTMIHNAVAFGSQETIQFLLESKQKIAFNLEARTTMGNTILHVACWKKETLALLTLSPKHLRKSIVPLILTL